MRNALTGCVAVLVAVVTVRAQDAPRGWAHVDVTVGVATSFGLPVGGLPQSAFSVEVDGRPAAIETVRQTREPLSVALLVDDSGSMNTLRWVGFGRGRDIQVPTLSEQMLGDLVADGFRNALQRTDRARLAAVRGRLWISPALDHTREAFEAALEGLRAHRRDVLNLTSSPLWDAAGTLVDLLSSEPQRRLVVIVTDGKVNANLLSPEELAERAVTARVAIAVVDESQAILLRQDRSPQAAIRPDRALRWVAEATGGAYLADAVLRGAPEPANPAGLVSRAIQGHRHAYTLTLRVPDHPAPQTLEVSVTRPDAVVRAPAFIRR